MLNADQMRALSQCFTTLDDLFVRDPVLAEEGATVYSLLQTVNRSLMR